MSDLPLESPVPAERSAHGAWVVLGVTFLCSTALGVFFFARYSETLSYVKATLEAPADEHPWAERPFTPEECIDHSLEWAGECTGVKSMCDMYVDQVMALCMESQDRVAYCLALGDQTRTTEFGARECFARGTQRNVDAEACAASYRFIDGFCETILGWEAEGSAADGAADEPASAGGAS